MLCASRAAWEDAGLPRVYGDPSRLCAVVGTGELSTQGADLTNALAAAATSRAQSPAGALRDVAHLLDPLRRLRHLPNIPAASVAIQHGVNGRCLTLLGLRAGLQAVSEAAEMVSDGTADVVLTGAADARIGSGLEPPIQWTRSVDPKRACRPFDRARTGTAIGEGAAMLVVESEASVLRRKVAVYAEIGDSAEPLDRRSAADKPRAGIMIAHGDGTLQSDAQEAEVIQCFVEANPALTVTSLKSCLGHTLSAAGAFNVLVAALVVAGRTVPPLPNLETPCVSARFLKVAERTAEQPVVVASAGDASGRFSGLWLRPPCAAAAREWPSM